MPTKKAKSTRKPTARKSIRSVPHTTVVTYGHHGPGGGGASSAGGGSGGSSGGGGGFLSYPASAPGWQQGGGHEQLKSLVKQELVNITDILRQQHVLHQGTVSHEFNQFRQLIHDVLSKQGDAATVAQAGVLRTLQQVQGTLQQGFGDAQNALQALNMGQDQTASTLHGIESHVQSTMGHQQNLRQDLDHAISILNTRVGTIDEGVQQQLVGMQQQLATTGHLGQHELAALQHIAAKVDDQGHTLENLIQRYSEYLVRDVKDHVTEETGHVLSSINAHHDRTRNEMMDVANGAADLLHQHHLA